MASDDGLPGAPSLRARALLAVGLTAGFYLLALTIGLGLMGLPLVFVMTTGGIGNVWLDIAAVAAGFTVLRAIVPRRLPPDDTGVRLDERDQPALVGEVERVARVVGEPVPEHVRVVADANAGVSDSGGLTGRGERTLVVGLPLLDVLTVGELRAVLAHEFGHYAGGDTRLGPWTWRTQDAIARTVHALDDADSLARRAVRVPFLLYARVFLRVTAAVSRRQEFAADATAARVAGREAHAGALRKVHAAGVTFGVYWDEDVVPVLESGLLPDVSAGYARFVAEPAVARLAAEHVEALAAADPDPHASHPTLGERERFLAGLPDAAPLLAGEDGGRPAGELIESREALEARLLRTLAPDGEDVTSWSRIAWGEVGERVHVPRYERLAGVLEPRLSRASVADLPRLAADAAGLGREVVAASGGPLPDDEAILRGVGLDALHAALAVALHRAGWRVESLPGRPVVCRRGERTLEPFAEVARLAEGGEAAEGWAERAVALGIVELPLGRPEPSPVTI